MQTTSVSDASMGSGNEDGEKHTLTLPDEQ